MKTEEKEFTVYKGLQLPLVFKGFKGKFIYHGVAVVVLSFILCGILYATVGTLPSLLVLAIGLFGGFFYLSRKQKKGLHNKSNVTGIFIVSNKFKINIISNDKIEE